MNHRVRGFEHISICTASAWSDRSCQGLPRTGAERGRQKLESHSRKKEKSLAYWALYGPEEIIFFEMGFSNISKIKFQVPTHYVFIFKLKYSEH